MRSTRSSAPSCGRALEHHLGGYEETVAVDLDRALTELEYRESVVGLADPLVTFLRRVGAYAYDHHETIDFTDWNGAIVGRGAGPVSRSAIPLDPTLAFSEFELLLTKGVFSRAVVGRHPSTPAATLLALTEDEHLEVQEAVVSNPRCSEDVVERLCRSRFRDVRRSAAVHPRLTSRLFEALLERSDSELRESLAWRNDLDASTLARILDKEPSVDHVVARHPNVTPQLLLRVASSQSRWTLEFVARNPLAPAEALELISKQELSFDVKAALANHAATPAHVLNQLAGDPDVRPALSWRRDLPGEAQLICAGASASIVRQAIARYGTDPRALTLLLKDPVTGVRAALAENPNWHGLEDLALDELAPVRRAVAERLDAPRELLEMLAEDSQSEVARPAAATLVALHRAASGGAKKG